MKKWFIFCLLILSASAWSIPSVNELQSENASVNWSKSYSKSVMINAPIEDVWIYASDSTKANEWSVFFNHISPMPGIADGKVGSIRRCFRTLDEEGPSWDEITIKITPHQLRVITTYNVRGFSHSGLVKDNYVFVRQIYEVINENKTKLTFQTYYSSKSKLLSKVALMKSKKEIEVMFYKNLINIKAGIEGTPRVYPWY